jgi:hypothetical protein
LAGSLAYVDTSAYLKLLFAEHESQTLEAVLSEWPDLVSSELLEVEMHRAAYREERSIADCDELLEAVNLVALDAPIRKRARRIGQPSLRAGDAIHLATAASLGSELGVLIAYDHRVLNDAKLEGLPAWAPTPGT